MTTTLAEIPQAAIDRQHCLSADSIIVSSAQAQSLLAALVGFIQPLIDAHVSSFDFAAQNPPKNGQEGQNLLKALEEFVAARVPVQLSPPTETSSQNYDDDLTVQAMDTDNTTGIVMEAPTTSMPSEDIQEMIHDKLRQHIFNNIPIRLLAFDPTGSGLQLIERGEDMFRRMLPGICTAASESKFQGDWAKAKEAVRVTDIRRNMIAELVENNVRYAILSHTWMRDHPGDVLYRDWATREGNQRGFSKVARFCEVAAQRHGVSFGWMDTVCVNKESSAELDESIRSMYKWYRGAHVCIAYMAKTRFSGEMQHDPWFTRGWTLQELLAPRDVRFYNMDWSDFLSTPENPIPGLPCPPGLSPWTPTVADIQKQIEDATTITRDELALCRCGDADKMPISRRLQLASRRHVTREEDTAYSLMGLLGVDISVAYGEGSERALFRLLGGLLSVKKHVLDIFNHDYARLSGNKLIPASIKQYMNRASILHMTDDKISSLLDQRQPCAPVILTHLGVQVPLLLVPAWRAWDWLDTYTRSPSEEQYAPLGDFSGRVNVDKQDKTRHYNLLDSRIYADDQSTTISGAGAQGRTSRPRIATFGVFNFDMVDDSIVIPPYCFSVALDCGTIRPGQVRPSDNIEILPTGNAPVFRIVFATNKDSIPRSELGRHGMQLITLYL